MFDLYQAVNSRTGEVGLTYVSCSPFRVPIARLAAAYAQLEKPVGD